MESDWHPRGRLPTLPSVAELLASSSRPASDSIAAYHHQPTNSHQPVSRSTPPNTQAVLSAAPANVPVSSEQSYRSVTNHASHASPSGSVASTSSSEQQYHQPLNSRPASNYSAPAPPSEACRGPPDTDTPTNTRRQDSAIAQQPIDRSKETLSSESNSHYSRRSPNDSYHSASPGPNPYPVTQSPILPTSSYAGAHSSRSHEQVAHPSAPLPLQTGPDSSHRRMNQFFSPDHPGTSHTRQQRYNVRFAANHTPANMPIAQSQKPRPSPPLLPAPASRAVMDSPPSPLSDPVARTMEPAIQAITRSLRPSEDLSHYEDRGREPSVERCPRCDDAWERPLPNTAKWDQDSPAENTNGFAHATLKLISQMRQHGKEADEAYEQWKEKHSHCPVKGSQAQDANPVQSGSSSSSHGKVFDGHAYASEYAQHTSSKRKSEAPHGDPSKHRKVTFDSTTSTAPPVRPSAPL